jgi:hypothetical protein
VVGASTTETHQVESTQPETAPPAWETDINGFHTRVGYMPAELTRIPPTVSRVTDPLGRISETIAFTDESGLRTTESVYIGTTTGTGVGANIEVTGLQRPADPTDPLVAEPVRSNLRVRSGATVWERTDPIHGAQVMIYWALSADAYTGVIVSAKLSRAEVERIVAGIEVGS